jgi:hypothetical protein
MQLFGQLVRSYYIFYIFTTPLVDVIFNVFSRLIVKEKERSVLLHFLYFNFFYR